MIIIQSIEITNFRSIVKLEKNFSVSDLNIVVGKNDIGKSNFLKALNLFFNGETDIGKPFRFSDDFSRLATVPKKKASEITIKLIFKAPERFKDSDTLIWKKVWRKEGLITDVITKEDKTIPSARSGSVQWVKKIKYKYIPAIKGEEYFSHLMGDLHDTLSEISPEVFDEVSNNFVNGLKSEVGELITNINDKLGYQSQLGMPSNFKSLFSTLDFSIVTNGVSVSLNKRGDGIKAQYIPLILKFIAEHHKSVNAKAVIAPETIWGFEEPENNLEISRAFDLANVFYSFSQDLQIFVNTHSPAFYSLAKNDENNLISLFLATRDQGNSTKFQKIEYEQKSILDEEVGVLPLIAEHIEKEVTLRKEIELKIKEINDELDKLKDNIEILVMSEDSDLTFLESVLENVGFNMDVLDCVSYDCRSNLYSTLQSCKTTLKFKPNINTVIFHRDSDFYDDDEEDKGKIEERLKKLKTQFPEKNFYLFKTDGYDLESYFINANHINKLYPTIDIDLINQKIDESTSECREESLSKIGQKVKIKIKEEKEPNIYKLTKETEKIYDSNPLRYRYGKKVLGVLKSKLQKGNGNLNLLRKTGLINAPNLSEILDDYNSKSKKVISKEVENP